ncbi:MAG: metal ABC transporter permease [Hyphomicrobiales bacterium]|nr:metal ABC transporter permease [Hyphomicrobiales bacterium]
MTTLLSLVVAPGFFASEPVRTAAVIGGAAAIVSGVVGVFTVIRGQSFAGHALADVSSAGGAGAFLLGINPLSGFLLMGVLAATSMELVRVDRPSERDLVTGIVTGAGLGVAALLLYLNVTTSSTTGAAVTIMFGSMFTISASIVPLAIAVGLAALSAMGVLYRPLLLSSLDPNLAAVQGVPVRLIGLLHLIVVALAVALSAITVGAILSTALLIGPAAIALNLAKRPSVAIFLAAVIGVAATWGGILLAYDSYEWTGGHGWPVSFCIVALIFAAYVVVAEIRLGSRRQPEPGLKPRPREGRATTAG